MRGLGAFFVMQTLAVKAIVLVPYKFTLLSNPKQRRKYAPRVLVPYKFTLLSNTSCGMWYYTVVLVPYKFTLLSNVL